jgi:hypothetical protein
LILSLVGAARQVASLFEHNYHNCSIFSTLTFCNSLSRQREMFGFLLVACLIAQTAAFGLNGSPLTARISSSSVSAPERVMSGARSMTMMPIGVPKVAYRMPGSRGGEWVDIYNRLTRERIIFMGSEIDDEMANQIIGVLLVRFAG